jgi:Flp pilus assembly protein TadB
MAMELLALMAAIAVALVMSCAILLRLDESWILGIVGVATFIATYWAVKQEHRRKRF